jgi:hypothetical protein
MKMQWHMAHFTLADTKLLKHRWIQTLKEKRIKNGESTKVTFYRISEKLFFKYFPIHRKYLTLSNTNSIGKDVAKDGDLRCG